MINNHFQNYKVTSIEFVPQSVQSDHLFRCRNALYLISDKPMPANINFMIFFGHIL